MATPAKQEGHKDFGTPFAKSGTILDTSSLPPVIVNPHPTAYHPPVERFCYDCGCVHGRTKDEIQTCISMRRMGAYLKKR